MLVLAVAGCGGQGPEAPSPEKLTAMLQGADPKAQLEAAAWAKQLGPAAAETVPALAGCLKSPHAAVRQSVAAALGEQGPAAAPAVPALTGALSDPQYEVRKAAADALGNLGPGAASAIPALEQLSRQPDPCNSAKAALKKIRS
jgi:HEAT repeat protein